MDLNLLLSAQSLHVAPELQRGDPVDGVFVVKNCVEGTYLRVTEPQWKLLLTFREGRTVPAVFDELIRTRGCPRMGGFFELVIKAVQARILLEPGGGATERVPWKSRVALRPSWLFWPLVVIAVVGTVVALAASAEWPRTLVDVAAGGGILVATLSIGGWLATALLAGGGGEGQRPAWRWRALPPCIRADTKDAVMLPPRAQLAIFLARGASVAAGAGLAAWLRPAWSFLPLLGLLGLLRPVFGGEFFKLLSRSCERGVSDVERNLVFPPNRTPRERWRLLWRALERRSTWIVILYGVLWTLTLVYVVGRVTDEPPWTLTFWRSTGLHVSIAIGGSLLLLASGYLGWELFQIARERAHAQSETWKQWRARWFFRRDAALETPVKLRAIASSPLFNAMEFTDRQALAQLMVPSHVRAWKRLPAKFGTEQSHFGVILSGTVQLRRIAADGVRVASQVLAEGDVIGLHDLADPGVEGYTLRTLTPVTLLVVERNAAIELLSRIDRAQLRDRVLKLPFLRRISLCQNWHLQAVERFAKLAELVTHDQGDIIHREGERVGDFCVIFEGKAEVSRGNRKVATIRNGRFFGEIGLLQNSTSNATVVAARETRCLRIARAEFMRFVTHNHVVALELERVSSERLGRPIFPLQESDFPEK